MKALICLLVLLPLIVFSQPMGETHTAGTTWYDLQHVGSCGRMIAVDTMGYVHVAWMNGYNQEQLPRHVYYNAWVPESSEFLVPGGIQIDATTRSGYVTLACTQDGYAIPIFNTTTEPEVTSVPICCDLLPHVGAFYCYGGPTDCVWPHGTIDAAGNLHLVVMAHPEILAHTVEYVRATQHCDPEWPVEWTTPLVMDTIMNLGHAIASSQTTDRVVMGWPHPRTISGGQINNDIFLRISENSGDSWSDNLNITNFVPGDTACLDETGNWTYCVHDTFRAYTDLSLLFDEEDVIHAAFTTRLYYEFDDSEHDPFGWISQSGIWHWNEATEHFSLVAGAFHFQTVEDSILVDNGAWQLNVQRPSLAIDTTSGFLYCAYMLFDSNCYSDNGYPMADVLISVSTDNGEHWSVGTNVTRTCPGENIPAPGSMHEREATLGETVTDGMLHLSYLLDHDAGTAVQMEGVATLNEFIYQRIPVDSIATMPLMPNLPIHADSTGFNTVREPSVAAVPSDVRLYAAYPNPFNSSTTIAFDLPQRSEVDLIVYDLLGRRVATLVSGIMSPGRHVHAWKADGLASGIYFVTLESPDARQVQKIMLLR